MNIQEAVIAGYLEEDPERPGRFACRKAFQAEVIDGDSIVIARIGSQPIKLKMESQPPLQIGGVARRNDVLHQPP